MSDGLQLLLPEMALAGGICAVLAVDVLMPARGRGHSAWIGVATCLVALWTCIDAPRGSVDLMLRIDGIAALMRPLTLLTTALVLIAGSTLHRGEEDEGAWTLMVLAVALGAMLTAAAANLVTLLLGLEMMSIAGYALAAWRVRERRAAEAGMKFVLFGGVASGLTLFGMSHVHGITGHLDFAGIGAVLAEDQPIAVVASLCLVGVGLAYKLALVPFHFYAPDVYQGSPPLSVAVVSIAPKLAALAVLVRALELAVPLTLVPTETLTTTLAVVASLSLLAAAFLAIAQKDAKRIVAFSSIGHAGAALLAIAADPRGGTALGTLTYYLAAYAVANLGALVCLSELERGRGSCGLDRMAGVVRSRPFLTTALCTFLLSLAGLPPLAGFLGKWGVLRDCLRDSQHVDSGAGQGPLVWAAFAMLAATAISAWSYLLVIRSVVLLAPPRTETMVPVRTPRLTSVVVLVCLLMTLALGLWLDGFATLSRASGR